jgi:Flp pilus assembly pilin Flp
MQVHVPRCHSTGPPAGGSRRFHPVFMPHLNRTQLRSESGQAAIEYALVLPAILLILFALVNFGFLFNYWNNEQHLASAAARYAVVGIKPSGGTTFKEAILKDADADALKDNAKLCVEFPEGRVIGKPVRVTISYDYTPPLGNFTLVELKGTATQRLETVPSATAIPDGPDC